jgi:hypothetical protein
MLRLGARILIKNKDPRDPYCPWRVSSSVSKRHESFRLSEKRQKYPFPPIGTAQDEAHLRFLSREHLRGCVPQTSRSAHVPWAFRFQRPRFAEVQWTTSSGTARPSTETDWPTDRRMVVVALSIVPSFSLSPNHHSLFFASTFFLSTFLLSFS